MPNTHHGTRKSSKQGKKQHPSPPPSQPKTEKPDPTVSAPTAEFPEEARRFLTSAAGSFSGRALWDLIHHLLKMD